MWAEALPVAGEVDAYLRAHDAKELLRLVVIGSVDDGKSTLIGRLLYDSGRVYDDQLAAAERASARGSTRGHGSTAAIDLSLLTDGLRAEREQGITIDVAYRYFTTPRRKFIVADTPGHVQYTRNMATGASTADAAVILVDARLGVLAQTRRHAYLAALLGLSHLVVCVNKMDLVAWDQARFDAIRAEVVAHATALGIPNVHALPVSALHGDGVVRAAGAPWHHGPTLLELLETLPLVTTAGPTLRLPVQLVVRPGLGYRGFAGQLAAGALAVGDEIVVLPSGHRTRIAAIDVGSDRRAAAAAPESVAVRLTDEVDVARGDMLVHPDDLPTATTRLDARLVWMAEAPLDPTRTYLLKHTTRATRVDVEQLVAVIDPETLAETPAARLALNDLGRVVLRAHRPLFVDAYARCRATGAFILIDALTHDTVAAGMIDPPRADDAPAVDRVTAVDRRARLGQGGAVVELGGADAIGRAFVLERALFEAGRIAIVVAAEHAPAIAAAAVIAIVPCADRPDGARVDGAEVDGDLTRAVLIAAGKLDAGRADRR